MTSPSLKTIIVAGIVGMAVAANGETAQERVAKRVAQRAAEDQGNRATFRELDKGIVAGYTAVGFEWRGHEYLKANPGGVIHSASCTNHAPITATQYVDRVVTQECQRQHWPESGQAIHEPCNGIYCEQCRPHGRIWGISPVPHDWVMGTNGFMVPPGSPEAWPGGGVPNEYKE